MVKKQLCVFYALFYLLIYILTLHRRTFIKQGYRVLLSTFRCTWTPVFVRAAHWKVYFESLLGCWTIPDCLTWPLSQSRRLASSGRWASEADPPLCQGGVLRVLSQIHETLLVFYFLPNSQRDKKLSGSDPTWVRKKATYGLSTLRTSARMMGGREWTCFRRDILTKTGTERD